MAKIPGKIILKRPLLAILRPITSGVLCRDNHPIPISALLHPFANQPFRVFGVISVGSIDEVAAYGEIGVEQDEGIFILTKDLAP